MNRQRRSGRSYIVEIVLVAIAVAFVLAFLNLGWFEPVGQWLAEQFSP